MQEEQRGDGILAVSLKNAPSKKVKLGKQVATILYPKVVRINMIPMIFVRITGKCGTTLIFSGTVMDPFARRLPLPCSEP
jgi:hypothetical protein